MRLASAIRLTDPHTFRIANWISRPVGIESLRSLLDRPDVKLQFAGHETFPCRYGWLKKSYDAIGAAASIGEDDTRKVFAPDVAIADFGVGKNMVASMRHWSLACGIIEPLPTTKSKLGGLTPTALGDILFGGGDPYLERPASLWALHWRLASAPGRASTWYFAFNEFNEAIFNKETLSTRFMARIDDLREAGRLAGSRITRSTIDRDVECLMRTYVPRSGGKAGAEDGLECPLAELGLIANIAGAGASQFRRGPKPTLPDEVFALALTEFWQAHFETRGSLSVEAVSHEPGSPGRVFLLDEESIAERLERLTDVTRGAITWDESTGLRQVTMRAPIATLDPLEPLRRIYSLKAAA